MATTGCPIQALCDEVTCPICLEYFKDPVTITECGHNFCRACLAQGWGEMDTKASCPCCRETLTRSKFSQNWQLANVAEIAKTLHLQQVKRGVCEKHQEPLKLFCQDDHILICVVCDRSKVHKSHEVIPVEEASQEYKDRIAKCLKILRMERNNILEYKADTEKESQNLLRETKAERQKTLAEFRQLRQFLEEQEKLLLAQIEALEKEIARKREECLAKLSKELSSLESIILEMEEKYQQPPVELFQDVRSSLQKGEERKKFENPVAFPSALKWKIWDSSDVNLFLKGVMKQFRDALLDGLQLQKANVTLDPGTANPRLFLSKDYQSVQERDQVQHLPDNPERFDQRAFVLGCKEFAAGRHFWDVSVGSDGEWAVGVARKSVQRKDYVNFSPDGGIWAVGKWAGGYWGLYSLFRPPLSLSGELKKIRVCLNIAGGRLAFFDADRGTLLFAYFPVSFTRETLQPFFWLHKEAWLSLSP